MSESSRKTPSPLLCLAFAMLIAYAGCSTISPTVTTTPANTSTTTTVSSSSSASSSPTTTSSSNSPETTNLTSPASSSTTDTPITGSTATQATSPTSSPATVTTAQSSSTLPSTGTPAVHDSTSTTMTTGQSTSSLSSSNVTTAGVTNPSGQTATSTSQSSQPPDSTLTHENATTSNITEAPTTAASATPEPTTTPPTTPAPTTPAPTTPAPTTPAPTTVNPNSQPLNPDASFLLTIDVGPDKNVSCNGCNSSYVVEAFKAEFQSIPGFLYIDNVLTSSPPFSVNIRFSGIQFKNLSKTDRQQSIWDALVNINNTEGLFVLDSAMKIAEAFALKSDSLCNTERACNLGFDCENNRCVHMCVGHSCGDHGTCSLTISPDGVASPTCICNSDDETTYSGEYCQDSKISQRKVAAIVGGVLGAFCGLFIIIIIIMCCRQRESSSTKYQLGGTANQGYSSMGMKEL